MLVIWEATGQPVVKQRVISCAANCSGGSAATLFTTSSSRGPSSYSEGRCPGPGSCPPDPSPSRWKSGDMAPHSLVPLVASARLEADSTQDPRRSWRPSRNLDPAVGIPGHGPPPSGALPASTAVLSP